MINNAYILHSWPFRETSLILELLTQHHGRVSVLARGARRSKKQAGLFQPFLRLEVAWSGKTDLPTLTTIESNHSPILLKGKPLVCGFYLNELLMLVLHRHDPHSEIFDLYDKTIEALQNTTGYKNAIEITLRTFEKQLLVELGYGINFKTDATTAQPIQENQHYQFIPNKGFIPNSHQDTDTIDGKHLLAIAHDNYQSSETLKITKKIMRMALQPLLGDKSLKSREIL